MDGITETPRGTRLPATRADRVLGVLAIVMLVVVLAAIARGHDQWRLPPATIWIHLGLLIPALALTPFMLIRPKGGRTHRSLGYVWVTLMTAIAIESFFIPLGGRSFSWIWLISIFVLTQLPRLVIHARARRFAQHQRVVRGLVIGSFLVAGFFTLPFGRMLGVWLFG